MRRNRSNYGPARRGAAEKDRQDLEAAFRLFQNKLLHGPITALGEAAREGRSELPEAVKKLFGLE
jgi:glutamyl-tRNA reductase